MTPYWAALIPAVVLVVFRKRLCYSPVGMPVTLGLLALSPVWVPLAGYGLFKLFGMQATEGGVADLVNLPPPVYAFFTRHMLPLVVSLCLVLLFYGVNIAFHPFDFFWQENRGKAMTRYSILYQLLALVSLVVCAWYITKVTWDASMVLIIGFILAMVFFWLVFPLLLYGYLVYMVLVELKDLLPAIFGTIVVLCLVVSIGLIVTARTIHALCKQLNIAKIPTLLLCLTSVVPLLSLITVLILDNKAALVSKPTVV